MTDDDRRRGLLVACLGFLQLEPRARELRLLHVWLSNWNGIGLIAAGMARQGYDISLTRYDERGWRATFYTTGMEHSATSATGLGWSSTPWGATEQAARQALQRAGQPLTDSVFPLDDRAPR
jgi:hypothetical protein